MGMPLERTALVRGYGQDGHFTRSIRQRGAVPDGCTERLQRRPDAWGQEHGVKRTFQGAIVADESERLRPRRPGTAADPLVEHPLLLTKEFRNQSLKPRHINPFVIDRFG